MYTAKNVFQIKKSQQDAKLDRDFQNTAKNEMMEVEIFDIDDSSTDDIEEDIKENV